MTIWKYPLEITDFQEIETPAGSEILCVQTQHGTPCLWVKLNESKPKLVRKIRMIGTGHSFGELYLRYIGTFQVHGGNLVFHVFEELQ